MTQAKCALCNRQNTCTLQQLAMRSLPFIRAARNTEGTDWDRAHAIRRAMRGHGGSPGFMEDWLFEGAITERDASGLIDSVLQTGNVDLAIISRDCRHYQGPEIDTFEPFAEASSF